LHQLVNDNIWRITLKDEKHRQGPPELVISAMGENLRPHYSPDAKQIAFESDRSGYSEIWACDSNGSDCGQFTSSHEAGAPRWSPDGHYIAFESHPAEHSGIYVVEMPAGLPRLVATFRGANNGGPSWSRDGQWIYFYSDREGGRLQLWKVPVNGGSPVQVTRNGGFFAAESEDGRFLYYSKSEVPGIWRMPLHGDGEETRVLDEPWGGSDWALVRNGIYFLYMTSAIAGVDPADSAVTTPPPGKSNIGFFEFATGKTILICSLDKPTSTGLAVAPDGRSILFVQNEFSESNIMLNNFQ